MLEKSKIFKLSTTFAVRTTVKTLTRITPRSALEVPAAVALTVMSATCALLSTRAIRAVRMMGITLKMSTFLVAVTEEPSWILMRSREQLLAVGSAKKKGSPRSQRLRTLASRRTWWKAVRERSPKKRQAHRKRQRTSHHRWHERNRAVWSRPKQLRGSVMVDAFEAISAASKIFKLTTISEVTLEPRNQTYMAAKGSVVVCWILMLNNRRLPDLASSEVTQPVDRA
mmetsp:Transcript_7950/g.16684  ORF Transcript_7950/g.16684 Transcript_7950/m.16684 type:complete len:227 (+) Transcript_7950:3534-4214(+)